MSPSMCWLFRPSLFRRDRGAFPKRPQGRHQAKTKLNANENCFRFRGGWNTALGLLLLLIASVRLDLAHRGWLAKGHGDSRSF